MAISGFVNLSAEYVDDGQTSRGVTRPTAFAFAQENPGLASDLPHYPLPAQIWGNSPSHGFKVMLNSGLDVGDHGKAYLFGNYAENHADQSFNFRSSLVGTRTFQDAAGNDVELGGREFFQHPYYQTQCPAGNATCPADGYVVDDNVFLFSSIYPGGFTPRFVGDTKETYATIGYKGVAGSGLRYDVSVSNSRNSLDLSMYNSISPSYGADSQTTFQFGELIQKEMDVNVDLSYEIDAGLASPLTLSGGAEYRDEKYESTQGDPQSYGAGPYATPHPLFVETAPGSGVFTDTGTFTEVDTPSASGYGGTSPTYAGTDSETQLWRLCRPRGRPDEAAQRRRRRPVRRLREFRQRDRLQAERNLQGDRRLCRSRHAGQRVPCAFARPEQRPGPDDEFHRGRVGADGHLPGHERDRPVLRRPGAEAGEVGQLRHRHRAQSDRQISR